MSCHFQHSCRPAGQIAFLVFFGLVLALSGCAAGSGPRTKHATSSRSSTGSSYSTSGAAVATDTSTPFQRPILERNGSEGRVRIQSESPSFAGILPTSESQPPLAANNNPPVAILAVPDTAANRSVTANEPSRAPTRAVSPQPGSPQAVVQSSPRLSLGPSFKSPRAPAAKRDRAVEPAQFLQEDTVKAPPRPDTQPAEEPQSEELPPAARRRSRRRADPPEPQPESAETQTDETADLSPGSQVHIPLDDSANDDRIELTPQGDRITLVVRDAPLSSVLNLLARQRRLNVIVGDDTDSRISVTLTDVDFNEAWSAIIEIAGCTWTQSNNIIMVSSISADSRVAPQLQDRQLRVFPLNFVDAKDVQLVVRGILSPAGKVFTMQTLPKERRSTQETVVVEDIPAYVKRAAEYIAAVDVPPRQVMIEVHILQITLEDNCTHGVNLEYLFGAGGNNIVMKTVGFANPAAATASLFTVDSAHFNSVVQALQTTTDSKTLASPKVIVANGQQARIQIGQRFGYFVTTTTQTSTLQNVNFLNTGVVLSVTPQISADNQVLMSVTPEVSTGQITNGLPQTETTTTDTTVLLPDGMGMVIGGLIKETDIETQDKVPILGDLRVVGRLFQKRVVTRQRVEIIIALLPRIAPYPPGYEVQHQIELERAFTPLMQGPLNRAQRPFEAKLPDAYANPRNLRLNRLPDAVRNLSDPYPLPLQYFFPAAQEEDPPVVPPPPVPLHNLSLPPVLPAMPPLPPVDVIIPDAAEAARPVTAPPAPAQSAHVNSANVKTIKGPRAKNAEAAQPAPTQTIRSSKVSSPPAAALPATDKSASGDAAASAAKS